MAAPNPLLNKGRTTVYSHIAQIPAATVARYWPSLGCAVPCCGVSASSGEELAAYFIDEHSIHK
jgi:hypothetical protein